ncbi:MAG: hypothetical protein OXH32_01490 [Acidobacteria bacterium]|nr:hypothetical protein [Acidobacteriota bacterium]MXZ37066.1 hypothetical protein [Holophagales bacterium]
MTTTPPPAGSPSRPSGLAWQILVALAAWVLPGSGHLLLKKPRRAAVVCGVVLFSFLFGCWLRGHLYVVVPEQPLSRLATLSSMGAGSPYFFARYLVEYEGDIFSSTFEYGKAFLLTSGLLNLLAVLDAWDIASGSKD